jgi:hypothetical protein
MKRPFGRSPDVVASAADVASRRRPRLGRGGPVGLPNDAGHRRAPLGHPWCADSAGADPRDRASRAAVSLAWRALRDGRGDADRTP